MLKTLAYVTYPYTCHINSSYFISINKQNQSLKAFRETKWSYQHFILAHRLTMYR